MKQILISRHYQLEGGEKFNKTIRRLARKIKILGDKLFLLLAHLFEKSALKPKQLSAVTSDITDHISHLVKPSKMEDTLQSLNNIRANMLLNPSERPKCK